MSLNAWKETLGAASAAPAPTPKPAPAPPPPPIVMHAAPPPPPPLPTPGETATTTPEAPVVKKRMGRPPRVSTPEPVVGAPKSAAEERIEGQIQERRAKSLGFSKQIEGLLSAKAILDGEIRGLEIARAEYRD